MRICVVSYYFPPSTSVGGNRWDSMAHHLRELGHDVVVVTSAIHGRPDDDDRSQVVRAGDLGASDLLRRGLKRPELPEPGDAPVITPAPGVLTRVVVPDSYLVSWVPAALLAVRRLARAGAVDALVTSGPPHSTHLIGLALGRRRPRWLVDLRDGWNFESMLDPWPTGAQRRLDAWLERRVARRADVVVGATLPIAEDARERLGATAAWVPNGWDPRNAPGGAARELVPEAGLAAEGWTTLVHTGTLSGGWGRDPRALLAGVARHNARAGGGDVRVRLVLAGRLTVEDERLLEEAQLGEGVVHLGLLERPAALALQRSAGALALVTSDNAGEATGKIFEYLASGRPIVALARGNEAARIIGLTGAGVALSREDPEAIDAALSALANGSLAASHAPNAEALGRFVYPGPARELERLLAA